MGVERTYTILMSVNALEALYEMSWTDPMLFPHALLITNKSRDYLELLQLKPRTSWGTVSTHHIYIYIQKG